MPRLQCPECNRVLPETDQVPVVCQRCGADLSALRSTEDWTPVARVSNLAEAGYMADYLADRQVESDITQENEFNAATGAWHLSFLMRVPQEDAETARGFLTTGDYSEGEELSEEDWAYTKDGSPENSSTQAIKWTLLLLIMAGLTYVVVDAERKKLPPAVQDETQSLREFLKQQPGPWTYENESGVRSQLYYNAGQDHLTLEQDLDGDGVLEYQHTFQPR